MMRLFKWLRGDKNERPSSESAFSDAAPSSVSPDPASDPQAGAQAMASQPTTARVGPPNAFAGHQPMARFDMDQTAAARTAEATTSWTATGDTYLKKTTQLAAELRDNEKRLARAGDVLLGRSQGLEKGHRRLVGGFLNEEPLEDEWFFFDEHWTKRLS